MKDQTNEEPLPPAGEVARYSRKARDRFSSACGEAGSGSSRSRRVLRMDPAEGAPLPLETVEETKSAAAQPHQAGDRPQRGLSR